MSRRSVNARQRVSYAVDVHGIQRTPAEKRRVVKGRRLKALQRKARKAQRDR